MYFSETMCVQCILVKQWVCNVYLVNNGCAMYFSETMCVQCILVKQWVCNVI